MDSTMENVNNQRNKELFEYEMTEVLLKLKGEFSVISRKEKADNEENLSLKIDVKDIPEIAIELIEIDAPKTVEFSISQDFSVNLLNFPISSFSKKQPNISFSFDNIKTQKIYTVLPNKYNHFSVVLPDINIVSLTIQPLKKRNIKIPSFNCNCYVAHPTAHFPAISDIFLDHDSKNFEINIESQNTDKISLPTVKPIHISFGIKKAKFSKNQITTLPKSPKTISFSDITIKELPSQNITIPTVHISVPNSEINIASNISKTDVNDVLSSIPYNLDIDYPEYLKDICFSITNKNN